MKAWNGEDILISKKLFATVQKYDCNYSRKLSNDFKFDEDVENLVINITKN